MNKNKTYKLLFGHDHKGHALGTQNAFKSSESEDSRTPIKQILTSE